MATLITVTAVLPSGTQVTFTPTWSFSDGVDTVDGPQTFTAGTNGLRCQVYANNDSLSTPTGSAYIVAWKVGGNWTTKRVVIDCASPNGTVNLLALADTAPNVGGSYELLSGPTGPAGPGAGPSGNIAPTAFPNLRKGVTQLRAGTSDLNIVCIGDSLTRGAAAVNRLGLGWPDGFVGALNQRGRPAADGAIIGGGCDGTGAPQDPRVTSLGGFATLWEHGTALTGAYWGGDLESWVASAGAAALVLTPGATTGYAWDTADVYYTSAAANGQFVATATGGAPVTSPVGPTTPVIGKLTISAATASASNTATIGTVTGGSATILAVVPRRSTVKQYLVHNVAVSYSTLSANAGNNYDGWAATQPSPSLGASFDNFTPADCVLALSPSLVIAEIGVNDAGTYTGYSTGEQWLTDMLALQATFATGGSDLLPVIGSPVGPTCGYSQSTIATFWSNVRTLLEQESMPYVDVNARFTPWSEYQTWFYTDELHMLRVGYDDVGMAMAQALECVL